MYFHSKFLSYATSIIYLAVLGFLAWVGFHALTTMWLVILGLSVIVPSIAAWTAFLWFKIYGTYLIDIAGAKKAIPRRSSRSKQKVLD